VRRILRLVLGAALATAACRPAPSAAPDVAADVVELDVTAAQKRMSDGTLSSRQLTQAYLDRIAALDAAGPRLRAVIELAPDALAVADERDRERAAGQLRGPLHGIPVLIKDNVDVAGLANSAGSLALAEHRPAEDAFLVKRLREAGAVILGKTNLSEWANFRSLRSSSGWSSRGGQTKNPYVLDRSPCGSSSGTGAAIAANLAAVGIGTETNGSIICPSAVHALVGLKPTVGLVSRAGIIPISATQDTAGPMTRSVADAAILLNAIEGADPADPATTVAKREKVDYTSALRQGALRGQRIGVLRQAMGSDPAVDAAVERALAEMRAAGAELVDVEIATWGKWDEPEFEVLLVEFKAGLDAYLARSGAPIKSLAALIEYDRAHAREVMPWFSQELFEKAQAKGGLDDPAYLAARAAARRLAWDEGLGAALDRERLVAIVAPANGPAWPIDPVLGDRFTGSGYGAAAVAGSPSLTVPIGEVHGLPIGLVLLARHFAEADLLALGFALEQRLRARRPPTFKPTIAP
jgi:amidase